MDEDNVPIDCFWTMQKEIAMIASKFYPFERRPSSRFRASIRKSNAWLQATPHEMTSESSPIEPNILGTLWNDEEDAFQFGVVYATNCFQR